MLCACGGCGNILQFQLQKKESRLHPITMMQQVDVKDCYVHYDAARESLETMQRMPFQIGDIFLVEELFHFLRNPDTKDASLSTYISGRNKTCKSPITESINATLLQWKKVVRMMNKNNVPALLNAFCVIRHETNKANGLKKKTHCAL